MTITSSDPDENPYTLFLEGQVVAPEIVIEQPSGSNLPDGGARNFGNVAVGTNASLTFAIRNLGTGPLTGIAATLGGPDAGRVSDWVKDRFKGALLRWAISADASCCSQASCASPR